MGCENINELPECLLAEILSHLSTRDSVRTSVLSRTWLDLWLMVPLLDLKTTDFNPDFPLELFVGMFMMVSVNVNSRIQKFKAEYDARGLSLGYAEEMIRKAIDRGIQQLDVVSLKPGVCAYMPPNMYKSNSLVSLKLVGFGILTPNFVVSLPCVKVIHIENAYYEDERIMENLISGCPVLEDLTVIRVSIRIVMYSLRVRSQSLKRFLLTFEDSDTPYAISGTDYSVEVDAPRLEYMRFKDNHSDKIVIKNLSSLHTVEIDTEFNNGFGGSRLVPEDVRKRDTICNFLNGVSRVSHITISHRTLEVLCLYSKLGPIPKFVNVCRMQVVFPCCVLQFLPLFLESFPNLKNLNLEFAVSEDLEDEIELIGVPRCLSLTLETVEITEMVMKEENGIKLVKYFAQNSAVLKKLKVSCKDSPPTKEDIDIYKSLLASIRRSRRCNVFVN